MFMSGGNLLSSHDGEEGNANADGEEYDPTIFKTLLIKVVSVNSREDICEQYCTTMMMLMMKRMMMMMMIIIIIIRASLKPS